MDLPTVVLRDLLQLSSYAGLDDDALRGPLISLVEGLQAAVPSYRGFHLAILDNGHPINLTAFLSAQDGDSINTSVRIGFAALGPGLNSGSYVVFYAAAPGAFVDLAADFAYALDTEFIPARNSTPSAQNPDRDGQHSHDQREGDERPSPALRDPDRLIVLDADLPPPNTTSGLIGLEEVSMINRAVGILIDQGHHPDQAHDTLRRRAAKAGVDPHIFAARLLKR